MYLFYASVNTGDAEIGAIPLFQNIQDIYDLKLYSKEFKSYKECVDTAQKLVVTMIEQLNANGGKFFVQTSFNPDFGSEETTPTIGSLVNWGENELIRFYVVSPDRRDPTGIYITNIAVSVISQQLQKEH